MSRARRALLGVTVAVSLAACASTVEDRHLVTLGANGQGADADGSGTGDAGSTGDGTGDGSATVDGATQGDSGTTVDPGAASSGAPGAAVAGSVPSGAPKTSKATSGSGSSPTTGPIQLGFITTTTGNSASLGINAGSSFSDQQLYDALVKEYNKTGGVAGRQISPVYGDTDTATTDWSTQFSAACAHMTQDNKVTAVLGYVFAFEDSFEQCLAKANVLHLSAAYQPGDVGDQKTYPLLYSAAHPNVDVADRTVVAGAVQTGVLTKTSKLGILYDTCSNGDRAFNRTVVPYLQQQGISYEVSKLNCASGAGDASSIAAQVQNAVLTFNSHGVKTVWASGVPLVLFSTDAESQGYRPQYITSVGGAALEANMQAAQIANLHGFGWMPAVDVDPANQPYAHSPAQTACLSKLSAEGLTPTAYNDFMIAYTSCDSISLYAAALTVTHGNTDPSTVEAALAQIEPTFQGAATYNGGYTVSGNQAGGAQSWRAYNYATSCSCLQYSGPTYPLPAV